MTLDAFLTKKKAHIFYLLQIKVFFKKITYDIYKIISKLLFNLSKTKITVNFFKIKLNGIYDYFINNMASMTTLSSPKIRYFNKRMFGHDVLTPHQTVENNVNLFGAVYTSSDQLTIQHITFKAYFFNKYKPTLLKTEKSQYVLFSAFNQNQANTHNGMLKSF